MLVIALMVLNFASGVEAGAPALTFQAGGRNAARSYTVLVQPSQASACGVGLVQAVRDGDPPGSFAQRLLVASDCNCDLRPDGLETLFDPDRFPDMAPGKDTCRAILASRAPQD